MNSNFFLDVLKDNPSRLPVLADKLISDHYSDKAVIAARGLDLTQYSRLGHCELIVQESPPPHGFWYWGGEDYDDLYESHNLVVHKIKWQKHELEVVQLAWETGCGNEQREWIIAESIETAKAFMLDLKRKTNAPGEAILVFSSGQWRRSREMYLTVEKASFDDLVLERDLKESILREFKQFLKSESQYQELGIAWRRGAIFIGPPGNGKTHCVRALVKELGVSALYVQSLSHPHYSSEQLWGKVFERARKLRPCVLVLEDLDSLVKNDNRSFFLNQLDGFERNHGLIVLATTNYPDRIDQGIVDRPSRFDRKYHFNLPSTSERHTFLASWQQRLADRTQWQADQIATVAAATDGYSFAYLKELVIGSVLAWMDEDQVSFEQTILRQAKLLKNQMKTKTSA